MNTQNTNKVPPDGKWGWMIVLAYALNGISTISIIQGFGLIFKDTFRLFGFTATEGAIIINANLASGMILGLVNGPLLRFYGYRKMAIIGSLLYSTGVTMTAFARSFTTIMISYGIFASLGTSLTLASFSYALNSYFTTRRGRAMSLAVTIIGLGPIIVPQITTVLISYYGFQGAILLYGAFSLHSLIGGTLLQPLKWHAKDANKSKTATEQLVKNESGNDIIDEKNIIFHNFPNEENPKLSMSDLSIKQRKRTATITSMTQDAEIGSTYGIDIPYAQELSEAFSDSLGENEFDKYTTIENGQSGKEYLKNQFRKRRFKSIDTINLGSSFTIFEEKPMKKYNSKNGFEINQYDVQNTMENSLLQTKEENSMSNGKVDRNIESEKKSYGLRIFKAISNLLDLDLLRDPIYVNIMLGMSIAIFAEINFSQLTPFILMDMNLSTVEIANVMSVIAGLDLVFRSLAPFIGERLRQPPRMMYLFSLCLLIISRTCLLFINGFNSTLIAAIGLGAAKGIRSVYMTLVIPSYVPIHRLPNALGIQMIVNGILLLSVGPILGLLRDHVGNYTPCIIVMNCITAVTVIIWLMEMLIIRKKAVQKQGEQEENF